MNKNVIVNVRSGAPVKIVEARSDESGLYLVGEFTTFDVMNRNKRIYKKDNYKTVLAQIADKCASGALLGELGHPSDRSTTDLSSVSHVVTKLEIDDVNNCVRGELKLLSTPKGQIARTLVESGVPLYVSSRAAGYIGKGGVVTLTSLITYDLVDEPGFANARLSVRDITESYCGDTDECENVAIFSCDDDNCPECTNNFDNKNNSDNIGMDSVLDSINALRNDIGVLTQRIAACEANCCKSSKGISSVSAKDVETIVDSHIEESLQDIRQSIYDIDDKREAFERFYNLQESHNRNNSNSDETRKLIKYAEYIAEECNKLQEYIDYVVENCNKHEEYMNYVVENCNKHEEYMNYVVENCNKHEEYMNYVVENCNKHEEYMNYTANVINNITGDKAGKNNITKRLDLIESYLDVVGKEINNSDKKFESLIDYSDYLVNTINENNNEVIMMQHYLDEEVAGNVNNISDAVRENKEYIDDINKDYKLIESLDKRINTLADSINERLDAVSILSNDSEMNDVKRLLEKIECAESKEQDNINAMNEAQQENMFINSEEKRLRMIMNPSVVHIWEGLNRDAKLKIVKDMQVSKCLAVQTQSLMLTKMLNNTRA